MLYKKKDKNKIKTNIFPIIALFSSIVGFAFFYLIPFVVSLVYAFTKNPIQFKFVGFRNFIDLFHNKFFILGLKNTFIFMVFAIPISMITSLLLSMAIKKLGRLGNIFTIIFLIPLILPSASIARFWMQIFDNNGAINSILKYIGIEGPMWFSSKYAMVVLVIIYIWKNIGYNTVLFLAGLYGIPKEYYNCADVFGANNRQKFYHVTMVYLTPSFFLIFIMSFVNSFKIFREVYFIQGSHPHESIYLLQHFVNSTLLSLHYHKLVSAVYILTIIIVAIVIRTFTLENYYAKNLMD